MRILAIRGENLASLAEFEIDLTKEPLAGTGLFAITGETGAGKSTILDALCLALYGSYPRASVDRREKVLDPSGEEISVSDPKGILRRGASDAYAEVDFIGVDGIEYRARWETHRARGRPTGKLQKSDRSLARLDGSAVVATGIDPVLAAVEERSGFKFEEFRRSVLLAQGEFDAFLLADESQRAALLEKITGTEIYTLISMRVFEETAGRREALEALEQQRDAVGAKDQAALASLHEEHAQKSAGLEQSLKQHALLSDRLSRADAVAAARASLASAAALVEEAEAQWAAAETDRSALAALLAATQVRPEAERLADRQADAARADAAAAGAARALAQADAALAEARHALEACASEAAAAGAEVAHCDPIWQEAAALDQRIEAARQEAAAAGAALKEASRTAEILAKELENICARHTAAVSRRSETMAALDARKAHGMLADGATRIAQLFEIRADLVRRISDNQKELTRTAAETEEVVRRLQAARTGIEKRIAEKAALARQLAGRRVALASIDRADLMDRDEKLAALERDLDRATDWAKRRDGARAENAAAAETAGRAAAERDEAEKTLETASTVHKALIQARDEAGRMAELAEATLSKQASHLRSTLVEGEPCPVCGAKGHPFAHGETAGDEIARTIRARRDTLDKDLASAAQKITRAEGAIERANARGEAAIRAGDQHAADAGAATRALGGALPGLVKRYQALRLSGTLEGGADKIGVTALQSARDIVASERMRLAGPRSKATALADECETLQKALDDLAEAIESETGRIDEDRERVSAVEAGRSRLQQEAADLSERLAAALKDLGPFLAAAAVTASDLDREAVAVRRRLARLGEDYAVLVQKRDEDALEIASLEADLTRCEARYESSVADRAHKSAALSDRTGCVKNLEVRRKGLLGGMETETHRASIRSRAAQAQKALEVARKAAAEAEIAHIRHRTAHEAAIKSAKDGAGLQAAALSAFTAALARMGLAESEARRLLAVPETERQALAASLERLRKAKDDAGTAFATRRHDLEQCLAAGGDLDGKERQALAAAIADDAAAIDAVKARLAVIRNDLERDEAARRRVAEIETEIGKSRQDLSIWQAVDAAVGQKDGARFRRFAQGVTLGQLVALANAQLLILNRRYALRRGALSDLALEVIDHDMGDEIRSPRSLSGGERFLVSLALALALSGLEGRQSFVDTLFIDEGFGSLDRETLDVAITALESLQGQGRKVGVITHVPAMMEQIPVQVCVEKRGGGRSAVRVTGSGTQPA